jgi:hypothetical protein
MSLSDPLRTDARLTPAEADQDRPANRLVPMGMPVRPPASGAMTGGCAVR